MKTNTSEVAVKSVVLIIKGQRIEISVDEAKALQSQLVGLFGTTPIVIREFAPVPNYIGPVYPSAPAIPPYTTTPYVTCTLGCGINA